MLTNTGSLLYKTETKNVYKVLYKVKSYLNSIIVQKIQNITTVQITIIRKMKVEARDVPIKGFVILKLKLYNFITEDNHESKKTKPY